MKTLLGTFTSRRAWYGRGDERPRTNHVAYTFECVTGEGLRVRVPQDAGDKTSNAGDLDLLAVSLIGDPVTITVDEKSCVLSIHAREFAPGETTKWQAEPAALDPRSIDPRPDVCRHCDTTATVLLSHIYGHERTWKCQCGQLIRRETIGPEQTSTNGDDISTAALVMWLDAEAAGRKPVGDRAFWLRTAARRLAVLYALHEAEGR